MKIPKEVLIKLGKKVFEAESKRTETILQIKSQKALKSGEPGAAQKAARLNTALGEISLLRKRVDMAATIQKPASGSILIRGLVVGKDIERIKGWSKDLKVNLYKEDGSSYSGASSVVSEKGEFSMILKSVAGAQIQKGALKLEDKTGRSISLKEPLALKPGAVIYREFLLEFPRPEPEKKKPPVQKKERKVFRPVRTKLRREVFRKEQAAAKAVSEVQKRPRVPSKEQPQPETTRYLGNTSTKEVHDLKNRQKNCQINEIKSSKNFKIIDEALKEGYDYCAYCFDIKTPEKPPAKKPKVRYLGNTVTKEIHDLNNRQENCQIDEIKKLKKFRSLNEALEAGYDYCAYCFGKEKSKK